MGDTSSLETLDHRRHMFGVLLETRARRQRRSGGAALSVAVHLAIIGGVTAASAPHGPEKRKPLEPVVIRFTPPAPTPQPRRVTSALPTDARRTAVPTTINIRHIDVPVITPTSLPPIVPASGGSVDSIVIGSAPRGPLNGGGGLLATDERGGNEWRGTEALMHLVKSAKPKYPEPLRQAGIDGRVLVRFTVDTLGAIDMSSVQILQSTHEMFSRSVRDILSSFHFRPAESNGRRVPALAEMPFEFAIRR
jgi:periplasmic protein TonB